MVGAKRVQTTALPVHQMICAHHAHHSIICLMVAAYKLNAILVNSLIQLVYVKAAHHHVPHALVALTTAHNA